MSARQQDKDMSYFAWHTTARLSVKDISYLTCQPGCQIKIFLTLHDTAARLSYKDISHLTCQPGCQIKIFLTLHDTAARLSDKDISPLTCQPGRQMKTFPTLQISPGARSRQIPGNVSLLAKCSLKEGWQRVLWPNVLFTMFLRII